MPISLRFWEWDANITVTLAEICVCLIERHRLKGVKKRTLRGQLEVSVFSEESLLLLRVIFIR